MEDLVESGVLDYIRALKKKGTVRHIGFSSHNPEVAEMLLDTKLMDMMMFSLNPAYDLEKGDENARESLLSRCWELLGAKSVEEVALRWAILGDDAVLDWFGGNKSRLRR